MLIYRIEEKKNKEGPWISAIVDKLGLSMYSSKAFPSWYDEFDRNFPKNYYGGVQSVDLLKHWFSIKTLLLLQENNYILQVYKTIPYMYSDLQVVFLKENLIKEYDLPKSKSSMYRFLNKLREVV